MPLRTLPPGASLRWCSTCNARERLHVDGRCVVCDTANPRPALLHSCPTCGRPCTDRFCSTSCDWSAEG